MYLIRDLYSEYIRNSYNSIIKRQPNFKNGQKIQTDISPKKITQMSIKDMKRCSTSLIIKKMQTKTTMGYQFTPTRKAIIKDR